MQRNGNAIEDLLSWMAEWISRKGSGEIYTHVTAYSLRKKKLKRESLSLACELWVGEIRP